MGILRLTLAGFAIIRLPGHTQDSLKKPVKRVILLEEALSDLMEAEYILSTIESWDVFQSFTDTSQEQMAS